MADNKDIHSVFAELVECSGEYCPRYTSYPPANRLHFDNDIDFYQSRLRTLVKDLSSISLYGHIPFCKSLCFFCACNREITKNKARAKRYLEALHIEIKLLAKNYFGSIPVESLHLGGGTPNFLSASELDELLLWYKKYFTWSSKTGFSIELDPRTTTTDQLKVLGEHHCTRISVGVQDFNPIVQKRINRVQSFEQTRGVFEQARDLGITRTGVDLIYGLPLQTRNTFQKTLQLVTKLNPDRVAVYGYAHVQSIAPGQQSFFDYELPSKDLRLDLLCDAISYFTEHGYHYIGIDHFVKASDPLYKAFWEGTLGRSFMGYTSERGIPVVATGASAISMFPDMLIQNIRSIRGYEDYFLTTKVPPTDLPIEKGFIKDSLVIASGYAIESLLTIGSVDFNKLHAKFGAVSEIIMERALNRLAKLSNTGLVIIEPEAVYLTRMGQIFGRVVASCFDPYVTTTNASPASLVI